MAEPEEPSGRAPGLSRGRAWTIFAAALVAQAWILRLPFQLDDYSLLAEPLRLFHPAELARAEDVPAYMLRWPLWALWAALRALGPEPLAPALYHAVGLALHGAVAVLLARAVARLSGAELGADAGLLAGLAVALAAGAIQAASWVAAWSDLLFPLFALLALDAFLGRPLGVRRAALGGMWTLLALTTKSAAAVVPVALLALVWARSRGERRRHALRASAAILAACALAALCRWLFLGTLAPRYGTVAAPGLAGLPALLPRALQALAQGLFPWNRSPLFGDVAPWLARLLLAPLGAGRVLAALALVLPWPLAALAARPRLAGPLALALALALLALLPTAVIYTGTPTNVVARTTYAALLPVFGGLGIALAALWHTPRARWIGAAGTAALALLLLDGRAHVVRTELLAAAEQEHARALLERAARESAADDPGLPFAALVLAPPAGMGGVPVVGELLPRALRPPFAAEPGVRVEAFADEAQLLRTLPDLGLARAAVALFAPEAQDGEPPAGLAVDERSPATLRAARRLARRSPTRHGPERLEELEPARVGSVGSQSVWRLSEPVPAHALGAVAIALPAGDALSAVLALLAEPEGGAPFAFPIEVAASPSVRRLALAPPWTLARLAGPPVRALVWRGATPLAEPPQLLEALPALAPLEPAPHGELALDAARPPRFVVRAVRGDSTTAPFARLELSRRTAGGDLTVWADVALGAARSSGEPFELVLERIHLAPPERPAPDTGEPWTEFVGARLLPLLERDGLDRLPVRWRVTLLLACGTATARSPLQPATFVRR